jgi:glutaredoxin
MRILSTLATSLLVFGSAYAFTNRLPSGGATRPFLSRSGTPILFKNSKETGAEPINGEVNEAVPEPPTLFEDITENINMQAVPEPPTLFGDITKNINMRLRVFQDAQSKSFNLKQSAAFAIAGEYDEEAVFQEIDDIVKSNPCVMFTWESSPSCKQAVAAFELIGVKVKNVRLDNPWSEGNLIRAEIGRRVGKSSVPMIFIGGEYIGGYDAGISEEAPGIVSMAFKGTLRPKLQTAGALLEQNMA